MIGVDLQTFNVQTVIKSCVCVCGVCVCVCVCVCERERERERDGYYMVQTLECSFIQGSDKVVMVIC